MNDKAMAHGEIVGEPYVHDEDVPVTGFGTITTDWVSSQLALERIVAALDIDVLLVFEVGVDGCGCELATAPIRGRCLTNQESGLQENLLKGVCSIPTSYWTHFLDRLDGLQLTVTPLHAEELCKLPGMVDVTSDHYFGALGWLPTRVPRKYSYFAVWSRAYVRLRTTSVAVAARKLECELQEAMRSETSASQESAWSETNLTNLSVDYATYQFRSSVRAFYNDSSGLAYVEGLSPVLSGNGKSRDAALRDLAQRLHISFVRLEGLRDTEMSVNALSAWRQFVRLIDIEEHAVRQSIRLVRVGVLIDNSDEWKWNVRWEDSDDESIDALDISTVTPSAFRFLRLQPGDRFEAEVLSDYAGTFVQQVVDCRAIAANPIGGDVLKRRWIEIDVIGDKDVRRASWIQRQLGRCKKLWRRNND